MSFTISPSAPLVSTGLFRNDINALRAWAVISVMFYHFSIPGFSGGYIGVDIFFVISGFLMTGIVISGLEKNKFSVFDFYIARARRIFPALIFLCCFLVLIGWLLLAPDDYAELAKHIRGSLLFYSNNIYRKESGYFDSESHEKWLLHTWSLSIEWQFYLLLPVIVFGLWRWKNSNNFIFLSFILLAFLSFVMCIIRTQESPDSAFYSIKYRYWEMLLGGIAYFISRKIEISSTAKTVLLFLGGALTFIPVFLFDANTDWPGWRAAFPALGACIFIVVGADDFFKKNFLVLQWVGSRSYSIYLWHWPVVVALSYFGMADSYLWVLLGVIISCLTGWVSYKWIETPSGIFLKSRRDAALIISVALVLVFISAVIVKQEGFPGRVSKEVLQIMDEKNNINKRGAECDSYGKSMPVQCIYGGKEIKAIVLGDSHATAIVTAVKGALNHSADGLVFWGRSACPFIIGAKGMMDEEGCVSFNAWVLDMLKKEPSNVPVIIASRLSYYALGANEGAANKNSSKPKVYFSKEYENLDSSFLLEFKEKTLATICEVAKFRKVYIVMPIPEMGVNVPRVLARAKILQTEKNISISMKEYYQRHDFILGLGREASELCGIEILDPLPYLCSKNKCFADKNGRPMYSDDDHLSEFGNQSLIPMFETVFNAK